MISYELPEGWSVGSPILLVAIDENYEFVGEEEGRRTRDGEGGLGVRRGTVDDVVETGFEGVVETPAGGHGALVSARRGDAS